MILLTIISFILFGCNVCFSQDTIKNQPNFQTWEYYNKYNKIIQKKYINPNLADIKNTKNLGSREIRTSPPYISEYELEKIKSKMITRNLTSSISDDEIAGILLKRGSRNLNTSVLFIGVGAFVASTAAWLPQLLIGKNNKTNLTQQDIQLIIFAVSGGCFITSIVKLIMGYKKIGDAGIVLQHKKFNIKTTGTSISLNF